MVVEVDGTELIALRGNACPRGKTYAQNELFHATQMLTTTVAVDDRPQLLCVKTQNPIPKESLMDCMDVLRNLCVSPPVQIGQVVMPNILNTGVDVVATSSCP